MQSFSYLNSNNAAINTCLHANQIDNTGKIGPGQFDVSLAVAQRVDDVKKIVYKHKPWEEFHCGSDDPAAAGHELCGLVHVGLGFVLGWFEHV